MCHDLGPRPASPADLPKIISLVNLVFRPTPEFEPTMQSEHPLLLSAANLDRLFVVEQQGRIVSHVGVLLQQMALGDVQLPVACIGSVATHPEHRGKGYAGQLMDLALKRAREAGCVLMPISGTGSLYTRRGAALVMPALKSALTPALLASAGQDTGIRPSARDDLDALVELLEREPHRYLVDRPKLSRLMQAHLGHGCSAWVRERGETLEALLVVRHGRPYVRHHPGLGLVVTFAGPLALLPALARLAMTTHELNALQVDLMPTERERVVLLEELGAHPEPMAPHWTILILDLPALLARFQHRWSAHPGAVIQADGPALIAGTPNDTIRLEQPGEAASLLFSGSAHWPASTAALRPETRAVLQRALPLPLPDYGLCYV